MALPNDQFYAQLPVNRGTLGALLTNITLFEEVPRSWHVIITDIKNSTVAVMGGRHEDVNLVATGSIVSVLNIAFEMGVTVPFFFGGDGATFIVPPNIIDRVMNALNLYKANALDNFGFELRSGIISVEEIYNQNHHIHIAKFSSSKTFYIPIVVGNGLNYAEQVIKGENYLLAPKGGQTLELDLTGMQCRWDRIPPPEDKEEVVTLLVVARNGESQSDSFSKIMNKMDELYGPPRSRQPISIAKLKFKTTFNRLGVEMRMRLGKLKWFELVRDWVVNLYGHIYFQTKSGRNYLKSLVEMSDTLVIDGKINTVISGNAGQRKNLVAYLDEMEAAGEIIFGLHISKESVMSCYVRDLKDDHIHFVDGAEGGYTQAASMLKGKLRDL